MYLHLHESDVFMVHRHRAVKEYTGSQMSLLESGGFYWNPWLCQYILPAPPFERVHHTLINWCPLSHRDDPPMVTTFHNE
jgi:hypothetical protein